MSYRSSTATEFRTDVHKCIGIKGEVCVIAHYSRAAGSKSVRIIDTIEEFDSYVDTLPPSTLIRVFTKPELPLRGVVDDAFVAAATATIADGTEFLLARLGPTHSFGFIYWPYLGGDTEEDLLKYLADNVGRAVALGPHPPASGDEEDILSAIVPTAEGVIQIGIY